MERKTSQKTNDGGTCDCEGAAALGTTTAGAFSYTTAVRALAEQQRTSSSSPQRLEESRQRQQKLEMVHRLQEQGHHQLPGGSSSAKALVGEQRVFKGLKLEHVDHFSKGGGEIQEVPPPAADREATTSNVVTKASTQQPQPPRMSKTLANIMRRTKTTKVERPFEIVIPLGLQRMSLAQIKKTLREEYAARYCEMIGIAPTQKNMLSVQRNMPLDQCKITQVFNPGLARGERRNFISIQPAYATLGEDASRHRHEAPLDDYGAAPFDLLPKEQQQPQSEPAPVPYRTSLPQGADSVQCVVRFDDYKRRFVYPYNLGARFEADPSKSDRSDSQSSLLSRNAAAKRLVTTNHQSSTAKQLAVHDALFARLQTMDGATVPPTTGNDAGGAVTVDHLALLEQMIGATDADVPRSHSGTDGLLTTDDPTAGGGAHATWNLDPIAQRELELTFPSFDESDVKMVLLQFVADFPFTRFYAHLPRQHILRVKNFLQSPEVSSITVILLDFLFLAYLAPHTASYSGRATPSARDAAFVLFLEGVLKLTQNMSSDKAQSSIDLPLLILALRVAVEALMGSKYPSFTVSQIGAKQLRRMDHLVTGIIDPTGMSSRLGVVESTPQAMRTLHSKRLPPRFQPSITSPVTHFIVGSSTRSSQAAFLTRSHPLIADGLKELQQHVTPTVRSQVLDIILKCRVQRR